MIKKRQDRNQLQMLSLETLVAKDSTVRVIDAFVDALDLKELGFIIKGQIKNGAPAFLASDLLKLYYYGYLNRVRSSRRLEREAVTNIEAMWLLRGVRPGYKTIANFRKENPAPLKKVFSTFNKFLKGLGLFDKDKVAVDGSKFRAQNSKKNNYNEKKVNQHLDYINKQTQQYLDDLDQLDQLEDLEEENESKLEQRIEIAQKLDHLAQRKNKYDDLKQKVEQAREQGQSQVSTTDPDARALPKKMNIVEVSYNVVSAAEMKNKLITNFNVSNESDTYALADAAIDAREVLEKKEEESLTVLADKGFDTGKELKRCAQNNITTIVAPKKRVYAKKDKNFAKAVFQYDEENKQYICPANQRLTTNGNWYEKYSSKDTQHRKSYKFQRFTAPFSVCNNCPFKDKCVGPSNLKKSKGRHIERSEYEDYVEENIERYQLNKPLYRKRQETMEHQFGTIKRQWGFDYTLLRTKEKVAGEFAIIFTCYNLRRAMSILGIPELIKQIKDACPSVNVLLGTILKRFNVFLLDTIFSKRKIFKTINSRKPNLWAA